jgi:hypothetical protein
MPGRIESLSVAFNVGRKAYGAQSLTLFQIAFNARLNVLTQQVRFLIFESDSAVFVFDILIH